MRNASSTRCPSYRRRAQGPGSPRSCRRCVSDRACTSASRSRRAWRRSGSPSVRGDSLTYRELDRRANALAWHLRSLGSGRDVLVGLAPSARSSSSSGSSGSSKAGGAYLPLDPAYPQGAPRLHARGRRVRGRRDGARLRCDDFDGERARRSSCSTGAADEAAPRTRYSGAAPRNLAYVIYTSGSTGRPKGVLVTPRQRRRACSTRPTSGSASASDDVWTLFHSYAFDFSVWEMWGALLYGGRLVVVPYWVSRSPEAFRELARRRRASRCSTRRRRRSAS